MRIIGLTGSIACGKSTVSSWLKQQPDVRVIDGDLLSRELTAPGGAALPDIRSVFGEDVFTPDGRLSRRKLSTLVFSDDAAREALDRLMAPLLSRLTEERVSEARRDGISLCFLDYPLLFEKGYDTLCDTVWCVWLPADIQMKRLMERDGYSEEEALSRMNAVLSPDEKASVSQVVIDNSGSWEETEAMLPALLDRERQAARPRPSVPRAVRNGSDAPSGMDVPAPSQDETPGVMERPKAVGKGPSRRKVSWRLPQPLIILLSVTAALILCFLTADILMRAYLKKQADLHAAEQNAILTEYPLEQRELIERYSEEYNLDPAFVTAIIRNESSFQPKAESSVGARGLMQLMPDTAEWIAGKLKVPAWTFDRMWDPETNIRFGCWYLNYLSAMFRGNPVCVACAYHTGQGKVTSWLSDSRYSQDGITLTLDRLPEGPTKVYAGRVTKAYGIYKTLYFADNSLAADIPAVPD